MSQVLGGSGKKLINIEICKKKFNQTQLKPVIGQVDLRVPIHFDSCTQLFTLTKFYIK